MKEKIKSYVFFILSALAVGGLSAFFTRNNMDINKDVLMPPLSPPPILFPIVWSILFILMGISAAMIYNSNAPKSQKSSALLVYALSLAVNFSWNIIFFNLRWFGFAFSSGLHVLKSERMLFTFRKSYVNLKRREPWLLEKGR